MPLHRLHNWLAEERAAGVAFAHGGVLATVSVTGRPRSRMLGVHLSADGQLRFHTSPTTRKVADLQQSPHASLTLAFQRSTRSVSVEGVLVKLNSSQLQADWSSLSADFRRSYLVFGHQTGVERSPGELERNLLLLPSGEEENMPESFCGYAFEPLLRVAYYSVSERTHFAQHEVYERQSATADWTRRELIP
jgi:pyridoxine/pyridoxamine 5'-phosphate oxidase